MIDIKFLRENPDVVKENIKKKFQDKKLPLVDEVIELDEQRRASMAKADELRANRNKLSKEIGALMARLWQFVKMLRLRHRNLKSLVLRKRNLTKRLPQL